MVRTLRLPEKKTPEDLFLPVLVGVEDDLEQSTGAEHFGLPTSNQQKASYSTEMTVGLVGEWSQQRFVDHWFNFPYAT